MNAAQLDQARIWYSASNEDSASEIAALQPQGRNVLCITASGSRAFELLLADPARVLAVDQNPAQTALAELYAAAYRHLDYRAFASFVGLNADSDRLVTLDALTPRLSAPSHSFWQANRMLAKDGLLMCGRWESFLRRFRHWAGPRRRALAQRLLDTGDRAEQARIWDREWDDWQWGLFLRAMALRPLWRWVLREPGIAFVPRQFDMRRYARSRFDHAARNLPLGQLPFAWLLLAGGYRGDVLPPFLTEQGHSSIRARLDRLELRTASLQQALAEAVPGTFQAASLSDYSSYCDTSVQREVWADLSRAMAPGSRVCERKFFNKTGMDLPEQHHFRRDRALEDRLDAEDGALFYTFIVAERA